MVCVKKQYNITPAQEITNNNTPVDHEGQFTNVYGST